MGVISLLSATTSASGSTATGNVTLAMPAPSYVPAGSICLAHIASTGPNTFTVPSGWALIRTGQISYQATQALYWHLTGSAELTSYAWTTGGSVFFAGGIACYAGVNAATPIDPGAPNGSGATANGAGASAPAITTQTNGDLIVGFATVGESGWGQNVSVQFPSIMTSIWSLNNSNAASPQRRVIKLNVAATQLR